MTAENVSNRFASWLLLGLGLAHGVYALAGEKPWTKEIAKRVTASKPLLLPHYITIGLWYAAVAGTLLCLTAAAALWWSSRQKGPAAATTAVPSGWSRHFIWGLAGVLALSVALRLPRLGDSLWNDEMWSMRMFVVGLPQIKDAKREFSASWKNAIYANPDANNHTLCTIETRVMHRLWQLAVKPAPGIRFDERWLRLPALVWGLLGIGIVGCLGYRLSGTRMGLAAALLLALHPWHIRFSTETRGYSAAITAVLLVMLCLHQLLTGNTRSWKTWACLAFGLAVCMLSYAAAAPVLVGITIVAIGVLLYRRDWHSLAWLLAANALAATVFLDLYAPGALQLSAFLKTGHALERLPAISLAWWQDIGSAFTSGEDWHRGYQGMVSLPLWQRLGLLTACYGLVVVGLWQVWRRGSAAVKSVVIAWLIAVALVLLSNVFGKRAMLSWYLCPLLPGMALCIAFGIAQRSRLAALLAGVWLVALGSVTSALVTQTRQPARDAAQHIQQHWPNALVAYFGISERFVDIYHPDLQLLDHGRGRPDDVTQMKALEKQAAEAHRPFVIWYGGHQEQRSPAMMQYLQAAGFQQTAFFKGTEEAFDMFVMLKS